MHDGRETTHSIKIKIKRVTKNLSRKGLRRAEDGTMSTDHYPENAPSTFSRHSGEEDSGHYGKIGLGETLERRNSRFQNMIRAGKEMRERRQQYIELERKQKDFPFIKYFVAAEPPTEPHLQLNWRKWRNDEMTFGWVGHSTVLINFFGTWIITDPVFSVKSGYDFLGLGLFVIGPTRVVMPALPLTDLPKIDLILVSHSHMDHSDLPSLRQMRNARHLFVPVNTADIYQHLKIADLQELEWGDRVKLDDRDIVVEAIEVKHFGWRFPWEPCRGRNEEGGRSYNAFMIEGPDPSGRLRTIVFAGDTAYTESFKHLGERLEKEGREVDVAIMPIGAYEPWIGAHCNPEQALQMTDEMRARYILPVHWNTIIQSAEPRNEPIEWLYSVIDDENRIVVNEIGQSWSMR